jgi:hypothetical protein
MVQVIRYLQGTGFLGLTLEADHTKKVTWWVDAAFEVQANLKCHTGGMMTLGKGAFDSPEIEHL